MAVEKNLNAFRHTPFLHVIQRLGLDWSGATFKMEVRDSKGGTVRITLNNAAAGSEGISAVYDAGYIHPETNAVVGATTITVRVNEATMEALPNASPVTDDLVLVYDLHATPTGDVKRVVTYGTFTVDPGVTD